MIWECEEFCPQTGITDFPDPVEFPLPVQIVSQKGTSPGGEMSADLMCASGHKFDFSKTQTFFSAEDPISGLDRESPGPGMLKDDAFPTLSDKIRFYVS